MSELRKTVYEFLSDYADKKFAVGVSGGRDSMCLLHAVYSCGAVKPENLTVVHVNHALRPTADAEQSFVKYYCEKLGVKFKAFTVDVKGESARKSLTIEQAARDLRYSAFYSVLKSGEADYILTAHHALDNAETVLMHIFRGSGLDGLRGIPDGRGDKTRILRPMLSMYPDELDEYARENDIEYVTDESNLIDDADRNYIRLNVIPMIEKRYSGAVRAVNALAAESADVCACLDGMLNIEYITRDGDAVTIADEALKGALASRYVRRALEYFTLTDITRDQISRVVGLADKRTGATVELSGGINAAREYGSVAIYIPRPCCEVVLPLAEVNDIDGLAVAVEESTVDPRTVRGGAVDLDKLNGAELRFRRDGDMFTPCGGKRKKLKQFFIDEKIPQRKRDRIPLIARGNEVLVIVGVQVSETVKQTAATARRGVVRYINI